MLVGVVKKLLLTSARCVSGGVYIFREKKCSNLCNLYLFRTERLYMMVMILLFRLLHL